MLTRELAIAEYDSGRIVPDRLTRQAHRQYVEYAERMLTVYRTGVGRMRQELHRNVWQIFAEEEDCPRRRIGAFCKLLDDASTYHRDSRKRAAALRREVFRKAAVYHPLVRSADRLFDHQETEVKGQIAAQLGRTWREIEDELFADVIDFHRLTAFEGIRRSCLLALYTAHVQAAMLDAVSMALGTRPTKRSSLRQARPADAHDRASAGRTLPLPL